MDGLISKSEVIKQLRNYADMKSYKGEVELANGILKAMSYIKNCVPIVETKHNEEIYKLSEKDFITHIITTICDYAYTNNYEVTDTVKVMGENLVAITEICNFDNWKIEKVDKD